MASAKIFPSTSDAVADGQTPAVGACGLCGISKALVALMPDVQLASSATIGRAE